MVVLSVQVISVITIELLKKVFTTQLFQIYNYDLQAHIRLSVKQRRYTGF